MKNLVHGVGTNDAGYTVTIDAIISGRRKRLWTCPIYLAWKNMLKRCYDVRFQARFPTYMGCSVALKWHSFSAFNAWMITQDWEGNHLDKDILIPDNKVYSQAACVLVPPKLNKFMTDHGASRGEYPIGFYLHKGTGKFMARCCDPFTGKRDHLGYFTCQNSAHEAWRQRKHEIACAYADQQADPRIAAALRSRYAQTRQCPSLTVDARPQRGLYSDDSAS